MYPTPIRLRQTLLSLALLVLSVASLRAQSGLKGEYYNGTNFEQKVFTRIDAALSFRWFNRAPAPGVHETYYSIRWTGKLLAPATGKYTFSAEVDDGIRVWVGNRLVIDSWQLNNNVRFTGSVILKAGQSYDLRVDFFNAMLEGEIILFWQLPDPDNPQNVLPRQPVAPQFFRQKTPQPKPVPPPKPVTLPVAAVRVKTPPPPVEQPKPRQVAQAVPKPTDRRPPEKKSVPRPAADTTAAPRPAPVVEPAPVEAFTPRPIPFEQSSYALTAEARAELDRLTEALRRNPTWRVDATGHTDGLGDRRQNQTLSEYRAQVVATYLIRHGIAADRIDFRGRGGTPTTAADSARVQNRHVTITIR